MLELSPRLGMPYIQSSQAQKHVTHNEALQLLDVLVQLVVESVDATAPVAQPQEGQVWGLGASPTGAWEGQANRLAAWVNDAWLFFVPQPGWRAWVADQQEYLLWQGTGWVKVLDMALDNLPGLGIQTSHDSINRLSLASEASLFSHAGAGHRLKINKAATSEHASVLFQTDFAGRAEIGTMGSEAFAVKVSPDGANWNTALSVSPASAMVDIPAGAHLGGPLTGAAVTQSPTDATSGRLLKTGDSATLLSASPALRVQYGGTGNTIVLTSGANIPSPPPTGLRMRFRASATNTGPATIALDGGSPIACRTVTGVALPASYIRTNIDTQATFDGAFWVVERTTERGSNANGHYQRSADGTLRCWRELPLGPGNAEGGGTNANPFRTAFADWTFPSAFIATPDFSLTLKSGDGLSFQQRSFLLVPFSASATVLSAVRAINVLHGSTSTNIFASCNAVGHWY
ncbi:MAG: DUF2793 domain-containing protein [Pararhodobacter sp.]